jgi:hypothetical protein
MGEDVWQFGEPVGQDTDSRPRALARVEQLRNAARGIHASGLPRGTRSGALTGRAPA